MIHFNGLRFGTKSEAVESLCKGRTLDGQYKVRKHGIMLTELDGEPFAWVATRDGDPFIVSAVSIAGQLTYMLALANLDARRLGLNRNHKRNEMAELARSIVAQASENEVMSRRGTEERSADHLQVTTNPLAGNSRRVEQRGNGAV